MNYKEISKFIALVLRHQPTEHGISLDREGYTDANELIKCVQKYVEPKFELFDLQKIVAEDNKGRYSFIDNCARIRANQGHSTSAVSLSFESFIPTKQLYHGTPKKALNAILESGGLAKMERQYVHLSQDTETAKIVAKRRSHEICIIYIDAVQMYNDGYKFYISENGVVLTETVPVKYFKKKSILTV